MVKNNLEKEEDKSIVRKSGKLQMVKNNLEKEEDR